MNGTTVLLTAIGYVSFLFLIAWWGDGAGRRFLSGRSRAFVYALSRAADTDNASRDNGGSRRGRGLWTGLPFARRSDSPEEARPPVCR
jgi:hypothetical protein